jgi:alkylhydroperoxidase family enzyme
LSRLQQEIAMRIALPEAHQQNPLGHLAENYAGAIVGSAFAFSDTTYRLSQLPMRVFEGARYRTALINGCQLCQGFRVNRDRTDSDGPSVTNNGPAPDEAFYAAVHEWRTSPVLSARERLAIEYAEGIGLDPQGLATNEEFWTRFKAQFSDAEIVDLSFCVAVWIGLGRAAHVMGLDAVCAIPALREVA